MKKSGPSKVARAIELTINGEYYMIERTTRNNRHYTWKFTHEPSMKRPLVAALPPMIPTEHVMEMETLRPCMLLDDLNPLTDFTTTDVVAQGTIPLNDIFDDHMAPMGELLAFGF